MHACRTYKRENNWSGDYYPSLEIQEEDSWKGMLRTKESFDFSHPFAGLGDGRGCLPDPHPYSGQN